MKNIKIVLLGAFFVFANVCTYAQVRLGVKVGPTFSQVTTNSFFDLINLDIQNKVGVNAGVFAEIDLGYNFIFQPGIEFYQKGHVLNFGRELEVFGVNIPLAAKMRLKVNHLDIPLLFKYELGNETVKFYAEAGPVIGYALSGNMRIVTSPIPFTVLNRDIDFDTWQYNRFEIAGRVGAGVSAAVGQAKLHFGGAFQHGFNDTFDYPLFDFRPKNKGFMITLGYSYPLVR